MQIKLNKGERIFGFFNAIFMVFMVIVTLYPFYYVLMCSMSDSMQLMGERGLMLLPKGLSWEAYKSVLKNPDIFTGYRSTLILVIGGTLLNVAMTSLGAFVLSRKDFAIKNAMAYMMIFTMYFQGGLIPTFLMVYKTLNLGDTLWALILPTAISTYNLMIMKANFSSIPSSLEESAKIDGANDLVVLFKIILPLSMPIIAVMILFYGVAHWNSWFQAMLYIRTRDNYPLQLILREILLINDTSGMAGDVPGDDKYMIGESIKYATIIIATMPILCAYPFIQRYFVKGIMVGAIKG